MKAVDTNIIIRFLLQDDDKQAARVRKRFKEAEQQRDQLLVSGLVLLETIWVLESIYRVERGAILDAIAELLLLPVLAFEQQPAVRRFVETNRQSRLDLSDALIAEWAAALGCEAVLTFDKKAAKSELFERL